jgi:hypothetical protein
VSVRDDELYQLFASAAARGTGVAAARLARVGDALPPFPRGAAPATLRDHQRSTAADPQPRGDL